MEDVQFDDDDLELGGATTCFPNSYMGVCLFSAQIITLAPIERHSASSRDPAKLLTHHESS